MKKEHGRFLKPIAITAATVFLTALALSGLTACGSGRADGQDTSEAQSAEGTAVDQSADRTGRADESSALEAGEEDANPPSWREKAARESLDRLMEAITAQYPGETFTDLPEEESQAAGAQFADSYYFAGKKAASGWQFVAGVRHIRQNPLDGMTCGAAVNPTGYSTSQFDDGRILLMEKGDKDTGLFYLYDILQHGDKGSAYLTEASRRGVTLIPPEDGPFLKVSMVKQGISVNEFVPLSKEQAEELQAGKQVEGGRELNPTEQSRIALCASREEIPLKWSGQGETLTEEMVQVAKERCAFDTGADSGISHLARAELCADLYGELRSETIANQSDLELIKERLNNAVIIDEPFSGSYEGILTLTGQDGAKTVLQLSSHSSGGFILGNASGYSLSTEDTNAVWSTFTQIDGWRKYGGQIRIAMEKAEWDEDAEEVAFVLENDTGGPIQYILSPIFYKQTGEKEGMTPGSGWEQAEGVSGFCGFVTDMEGESLNLTVPWKDAFVSKGPGLYKLGIQVMPEPDLRFEVTDYFELK